jgi:hypothetical protein
MKIFMLFTLVIMAALFSISSHALPPEGCDATKNETCIRAKKPTTVIRELNNSPCIGCQAPPPAPNPVPTGDAGYPVNRADVDACKRIADLHREYLNLGNAAQVAQADISALERDIAGYNDLIKAQESRVASAQRKIDNETVETSVAVVARCLAHGNKPTPAECGDFDTDRYDANKAALEREQKKLRDLNSARQTKQDQLAKSKKLVEDTKLLKTKLAAKIKNLEDGGECPKK